MPDAAFATKECLWSWPSLGVKYGSTDLFQQPENYYQEKMIIGKHFAKLQF